MNLSLTVAAGYVRSYTAISLIEAGHLTVIYEKYVIAKKRLLRI